MFGDLNYVFDAETGEVIVKNDKNQTTRQVEKVKKKKRKKNHNTKTF